MDRHVTIFRWLQGLAIASFFSIIYIASPLYILTTIGALIYQYPTRNVSLIYAIPFVVSILIPAKGAIWAADFMGPMLDYFDYQEILETSNEELLKKSQTKNYIVAMQPHGVISFTSFCSWVKAPPAIRVIKSAVASAVLRFPVLKNVMGIFGLTSASSTNVRNILRNRKGIDGCLVIYVGGLAELFKSSRKKEVLYLKKRKGFIKIALTEGVDIIPVYLFGNTHSFSIIKTGALASLSRKLQLALTYFWGKWFLPIPRDEKLLYVRGKPLGLPKIAEPTIDDIEKWHERYCQEVTRLFESYKEKLPEYKHKQLLIE